jgi:hypothetical protein
VKLSPWYAPLFHEGARWQYRVTQTNEWDEDAARQAGRLDAQGNVDRQEAHSYEAACTTSQLTRFRGALAVQLDCQFDRKTVEELLGPRIIGPPLDGVYLATARGLYQTRKFPKNQQEIAALVRGRPLFPCRPTRWSSRRVKVDKRGEAEEIIEKSLARRQTKVLNRTTEVWCSRDYYFGGDGCESTVCFAEGIGIASAGSSSFAALTNAAEALVVKAP